MSDWGRFSGPLHLEFLPDGRRMKLLMPFGYVDPQGQDWPVPQDAVTDGASIPRLLWTVIGGPFEGSYRNAAVIHDYYCDVRNRGWESVHRMFYTAMLACGVSSTSAKILYFGVRLGGPRWNDQTVANANLRATGKPASTEESLAFGTDEEMPAPPPSAMQPLTQADLDRILAQDLSDVSLSEIDSLADRERVR